jgi:translation initiation factor IF-1
MKQENIEIYGRVVQDLSNSIFQCEHLVKEKDGTFTETGHVLTATISGKIRIKGIRILPGDICKIAVSPYDLTKGRIMFRENIFKGSEQQRPPSNNKKGPSGKGKKKH